ncbi:hypothetical protein MTO96_047163 [Rhipicephalus appendiculatus]
MDARKTPKKEGEGGGTGDELRVNSSPAVAEGPPKRPQVTSTLVSENAVPAGEEDVPVRRPRSSCATRGGPTRASPRHDVDVVGTSRSPKDTETEKVDRSRRGARESRTAV